MVGLDVDLEVLEDGPDSEWERLELPDTHFAWQLDLDAIDEPHEQIKAVVDELWRVARSHTREFGTWCDYQLIAYDEHGERLFADGRRCRFPGPKSESAPPRGPKRDAEREAGAFDFESFRVESQRLDGRKDDFIDRLTSDRNWSFDTARDAVSSAPGMLQHASDMLKDSIAYQHSIVEQLRDRASGDVEVRARVHTEREKSRRFALGVAFGRHLVDAAVGSLIPFANHIVDAVSHRSVVVYPEFETAQQAMAYLFHSLKPSQLHRIFDGNQRAAGAVLALLEHGARIEVEREALAYIYELVPMLRSEEFEDNANHEERLAARFIIGRFAIHKMNEYDAARGG